MLAGKNAVHFQMQFPNVGSAKSSQTFQLHINKCGLGHVVTNVGSAKSSQTILVTNPSDDLFSVNCSFHKKNVGSAKMWARPSREVNSTCDTAKMWARPKQWARPRQNVGSAKTKCGLGQDKIRRQIWRHNPFWEANPRGKSESSWGNNTLSCLSFLQFHSSLPRSAAGGDVYIDPGAGQNRGHHNNHREYNQISKRKSIS